MRRALAAVVVVAVAGLAVLVAVRDSAARAVSYRADVQPIFDRSCTGCHPTSYPYLDLRRGRSYAQLVGVPAATDPAFARVLPGRPDLSYVLIHAPDPSNAALLTAADRRVIARWIAAGAPDD